MAQRDEWTASGRYFAVTVFSDGGNRDGLGWELEDIAPAPGQGDVFEIFRSDAGMVPVLTATAWEPVDRGLAFRFAKEATADLLADHLEQLPTDWLATNLATPLSWAGRRVSRWRGPEWPLDEKGRPEGVFAEVDADATPFAWLGLTLESGDVEIDVYQDNLHFGLRFTSGPPEKSLSDYDSGYFRLHEDLALPKGMIESVSVTLDTDVVDEYAGPILTEAVLVVGGAAVPLIAAEAYGVDEWRRLDESVVVLRDLGALERIAWNPPRPSR